MDKVQEKKYVSVRYIPPSKPYSVNFNAICSIQQCQYRVPSLSNLHTSEPDGQNGATYKTQTESHKRILSLLKEVIVFQSKRANVKTFTTVTKLGPSNS